MQTKQTILETLSRYVEEPINEQAINDYCQDLLPLFSPEDQQELKKMNLEHFNRAVLRKGFFFFHPDKISEQALFEKTSIYMQREADKQFSKQPLLTKEQQQFEQALIDMLACAQEWSYVSRTIKNELFIEDGIHEHHDIQIGMKKMDDESQQFHVAFAIYPTGANYVEERKISNNMPITKSLIENGFHQVLNNNGTLYSKILSFKLDKEILNDPEKLTMMTKHFSAIAADYLEKIKTAQAVKEIDQASQKTVKENEQKSGFFSRLFKKSASTGTLLTEKPGNKKSKKISKL